MIKEDFFYLQKRRNGVEKPRLDETNLSTKKTELFKNINSVVHIRQNAEIGGRITPNSSLKSSYLSKFNKIEDSDFSTEKSNFESFNHYTQKGTQLAKYTSVGNKSYTTEDPKVMQKVIESLRGYNSKSFYSLKV